MIRRDDRLIAVVIGALATPFAGSAMAQSPPARAPVLQALYDCKKLTADSAQLTCYAKATDDFEKAERSGQVVVIDKQIVRARRKEDFGLKIPTFKFRDEAQKDVEPPGLVTFKIDHAFRNGAGLMVFATTSGAVWRETEGRDLPSDPAKGSKLTVRRGSFGSYYCTAEKMFPVQCRRDP